MLEGPATADLLEMVFGRKGEGRQKDHQMLEYLSSLCLCEWQVDLPYFDRDASLNRSNEG